MGVSHTCGLLDYYLTDFVDSIDFIWLSRQFNTYFTFSLINYSSSELAEAAVSELNTTLLNGRPIHLRIDREGEVDPDGSSSVYVGNLPWQIMEEELNSAFARFEPYYCRVMKNMSGRSRGFAILKFHSEETSLLAISSMNLTDIGGRAIEVT